MAAEENKHFDDDAKKHIDTILNGSIVKTASKNGVIGGFVGVVAGYALGNHLKKSPLLFAAAGGIICFLVGTTIKEF